MDFGGGGRGFGNWRFEEIVEQIDAGDVEFDERGEGEGKVEGEDYGLFREKVNVFGIYGCSYFNCGNVPSKKLFLFSWSGIWRNEGRIEDNVFTSFESRRIGQGTLVWRFNFGLEMFFQANYPLPVYLRLVD